jgi:hypothetical protein
MDVSVFYLMVFFVGTKEIGVFVEKKREKKICIKFSTFCYCLHKKKEKKEKKETNVNYWGNQKKNKSKATER